MESEILELLDQIEQIINDGGHVPFSARVLVSAQEVIQIIDQARQSLPREITRARLIYQDRDRILQEAKTEAESTRSAARAEREALIAEHSITLEAIRQSENLKRATKSECDKMKLDADLYARSSLQNLQRELVHLRSEVDSILKTAAGGIELLDARAAYTKETSSGSYQYIDENEEEIA